LNAATADHLEHTDTEGIQALKAAKVQPVLLPGAVYALGSNRYPPARQMIDAGLAVVLATDFNPGSSPTPSMPAILSIACTQMKMTPAEVITAQPSMRLILWGAVMRWQSGKRKTRRLCHSRLRRLPGVALLFRCRACVAGVHER
jgi:cytosine/adenosine deaminase-related metal-dependent hydrolase